MVQWQRLNPPGSAHVQGDIYTAILEGGYPEYDWLNVEGFSASVSQATDISSAVASGGGSYQGHWTNTLALQMNISSDNVNDTAAGTGARTVRITGLESHESQSPVSEDVTLNGTTSVQTSTAFWRVYSMHVLTAGSGGENAGNITAAANITGDTTCVIRATYNQSYSGVTTIPYNCTGYLKRIRFGGSVGSAGNNNFMADVSVLVRDSIDNVYRAIRYLTYNGGQQLEYVALGGEHLPAGADVKMRIESVSDAGTVIEGHLEILCKSNDGVH